MLTLQGCSAIALGLAIKQEIQRPDFPPELDNPKPYFYEYGPLTIAVSEVKQLQREGSGSSNLRSTWVLKNTGPGQVRVAVDTDGGRSFYRSVTAARRDTVDVTVSGIVSCQSLRHRRECEQTTSIAPGQKLTFYVDTAHRIASVKRVDIRLRFKVEMSYERDHWQGPLDLEVEDVGIRDAAWQEADLRNLPDLI